MKTWQDHKIGTRLGVVFGALLLCVIAVSALGLSWLGHLNASMSVSLQKRYNTVELTHQAIENSITNARITLQLFETADPEEEKRLNAQNEATSREISAQIAEIEKSLSSNQEQFEVVTQNRQAYISARQQAKKLLADKKRDQAQAVLSGEVIPALEKYRASWQRFIDMQTSAVQQSMKESQDAYALGRRIALLLLAVILVLGAFASISVTRSITGPIRQAVEHAQRIASGDLTLNIQITNRSETGQRQAFGNHPRRPRRLGCGCLRGAASFFVFAESLARHQRTGCFGRGDEFELGADECLHHPKCGQQPAG